MLDEDRLRSFPKIELHRHLEGTFDIETLYRIAMRNDVDVPKDFQAFRQAVQFPRDSEPDFLGFLSKFRTDWYRSLDDVSELSYHSALGFRNDGIFYIEVRFSPEHFALQNGFDRLETARIVIDAVNQACKETDVHVRFLLTFNRSKQTAEEMIPVYTKLAEADLAAVVGVDLAGDEMNFPPELFKPFFDRVNNDGRLLSTIHAGEVTPSQQIWDAIRILGARRIGHGTSAIADTALQSFLIERGVVLEQCITSNYQTGSWSDEANHPFGRLFRAGVPVTLNSDDPSIQDTDLSEDYAKATRFFGLSEDDLVRANDIAMEATFLPADDKARLTEEYLDAIRRFQAEVTTHR